MMEIEQKLSILTERYAQHPELLAALLTMSGSESSKQQTIAVIYNNPIAFENGILAMQELGLSIALDDYYVFVQRGGSLAVNPTPTGNKKLFSNLGNVIVSTGVITPNDQVMLSSNGQFDNFQIIKDPIALVAGGVDSIIACYSFITVFNDLSQPIASKALIINTHEYKNIWRMAGGWKKQYPSMFAEKIIIRRTVGMIYSMIGKKLSNEQQKTLNIIESSSRVDLQMELISDEQAQQIKSFIAQYGMNMEHVLGYLQSNNIDSIELMPVDFLPVFTEKMTAIANNNLTQQIQ